MLARLFTAVLFLLSVRSVHAESSFSASASASELTIRTATASAATVEVIALPAWTGTGSNDAIATLGKLTPGARELKLPRVAAGRDLLFYRIALRTDGKEAKVIGAPQWVTDLDKTPTRAFSFLKTTTKKGLNCLVDVADAQALGVQHANVNISLQQLVAIDERESEFSIEIDGKRVPLHASYVRYLDQYIGDMTNAGIDVTGILLNYIPPTRINSPLIHPATNVEAAPNHMGAFNMTNEEGVRFYRAAMQFLAERYTQPDHPHGWMSGMIIGNEVQSHWYWNNQGEVDEDEMLRDYSTALRLADLTGRSVHAGYKVYASMDHHWTRRMTGFNGKRTMRGDVFLEKLNDLSKQGGDFPWAVAFHPYPENLFEPRFWQDPHAPLALNAPVITFKNIEVLPEFLRKPAMTYHGTPRHIALTEQGFHRKADDKGEETQAAALALGYYKISQMPEIDFFFLHRHQDHPQEGGLNLGVLDGKKRRTLAWNCYRDMDTPKWKETAGFALGVAGLKSWDEILASKKISAGSVTQNDAKEVIYDFFRHAQEAKLADVADWRPGEFSDGAGGWLQAILEHPKPGPSPARASFTVKLPSAVVGKKPTFFFGSAISAPSVNGVGFRVYINGEKVFSHDQLTQPAIEQKVDLSRWSEQQFTMDLVIDSLGNTAHDLAAWVSPRIVLR